MKEMEPGALTEALDEFDLYLADTLPPLLVAGSIRIIMQAPPDLVARHLLEWVEDRRVTGPSQMAESVCGAVARIGRLAESHLIKPSSFALFVSRLEPVLLPLCPAEARFELQIRFKEQIDAMVQLAARAVPQGAAGGDASSASKQPEEVSGLSASVERFSSMVDSAIDEFNEGSLARALSILKSADQVAADEKVPLVQAKSVWERVHDKIRPVRLSLFLSDPVQHDLLADFVSLFPPLSPRRLFHELRTNPEKMGRRVLIGLLQMHGMRAEADIFSVLDSEVTAAGGRSSADSDLLRDSLILFAGLLPGAAITDATLALFGRLADLPLPLSTFRELVRAAMRMPRKQSSSLLVRILGPISAASRRRPSDGSGRAQWTALLEQVLTQLAEVDDSQTRRFVLDYCLDPTGSTGVSTAPLAAFAAVDLSWDPASVSRLIAAIRQELGSKAFFAMRQPKDYPTLDLVRALSGTRGNEVQAALREIARAFPDRLFGQAARQAVEPKF